MLTLLMLRTSPLDCVRCQGYWGHTPPCVAPWDVIVPSVHLASLAPLPCPPLAGQRCPTPPAAAPRSPTQMCFNHGPHFVRNAIKSSRRSSQRSAISYPRRFATIEPSKALRQEAPRLCRLGAPAGKGRSPTWATPTGARSLGNELGDLIGTRPGQKALSRLP